MAKGVNNLCVSAMQNEVRILEDERHSQSMN